MATAVEKVGTVKTTEKKENVAIEPKAKDAKKDTNIFSILTETTCKDFTDGVKEHLHNKGIDKPLGPSIDDFMKETKGKSFLEKIWNGIKYPFTTSIDEAFGKK